MLSQRVRQLEANLRDMVDQLEERGRAEYRSAATNSHGAATDHRAAEAEYHNAETEYRPVETPESNRALEMAQAMLDGEKRLADVFRDLMAQLKSKPIGQDNAPETTTITQPQATPGAHEQKRVTG